MGSDGAPDLDAALAVARAAVAAGGQAALDHQRRGVAVEWKADRTPVTPADHAADAAIRSVLRGADPDRPILSEESGSSAGRAAGRWIVDPIDGTRGFARGGLFWGPLVALEHDGRVVAGAMALPALGRTYWAARGRGAHRDVGAGPERLALAGATAWNSAILSLGGETALLVPPWRDAILELATTAAAARSYGDLTGCAFVLDGVVDAWIEAGVKVWDLAPMQVLIEEAGGVFTDFGGAPTIASGNAVAAPRALHDHAIARLGARAT